MATVRSYRWFGDTVYADSSVPGPVLIDLESGERELIGSPPAVKPEEAFGPLLWQPDEDMLSFYYFDREGGQENPSLATFDPATGRFSLLDFCRCGGVAFSADGTELLAVLPTEGAFELGWFELATGRIRPELSLPRSEPREHEYYYPSLSPDGRFLLLDDLHGKIFQYEVGTGQPPELFISSAATPAWSPDGSKIVYAQLPAAGPSLLDDYDGQLMIANADGSAPEPLFSEPQPLGMLFPAWSPDGTQIAFAYGTEHSNRILVADVPERLRPGAAAATPTSGSG